MVDPRPRIRNPERLLITGVDGVVGANLAMTLADRFTVLGLHEAQEIALDGCQTTRWAVDDLRGLASLVREAKPHWVIHAGSLAKGSWDLPETVPAHEPEIRTCRLLAELVGETGGRLTVLSTDAVFAGPRMFHCEKAPTRKSPPFAQAALRVERALQKTTALIVRTHAYGWSPAGGEPGFAEQAWQALADGRCLGGRPFATDRHASPILATDLAERLHRAYVRGAEGLYHIAGAERTSQYRFAVELAGAFGLSGPISGAEHHPPCEGVPLRLDETSLNTQRARRDLGIAMPLVRDGLGRFAEQAKSGYRARLRRRSRSVAA